MEMLSTKNTLPVMEFHRVLDHDQERANCSKHFVFRSQFHCFQSVNTQIAKLNFSF